MLKSNVAWSTSQDSYQQGKDSAAKAVTGLNQTKLTLLYTGIWQLIKYKIDVSIESA